MSLYNKIKPLMPEAKGVISDDEFILLNRKEFHLSQVSPTFAMLQVLGARVGYPYRVLLAFLDQFASAIRGKEFNIILADGRLSLAAFIVWVRAGGNATNGRILAPRGLGKLPESTGLIRELLKEFQESAQISSDAKLNNKDYSAFTFVIGNSKERSQLLYAADCFADVQNGLLLLKDYAHIEAQDEREYLESKRIFPAISFEGHAFVFRMGQELSKLATD